MEKWKKEFIKEYRNAHKSKLEHLYDAEVFACAYEDAEDSYCGNGWTNGNSLDIEIPGIDTPSGNPELIDVPAEICQKIKERWELYTPHNNGEKNGKTIY